MPRCVRTSHRRPRPALVYMPRIPYLSTPAPPGLYRQGNTRITRSASSLASSVFPIRLRRVYAYTFSLVPCFYRRRPLQLRSTVGANACSTWCWSHSVSLSSACFNSRFHSLSFPMAFRFTIIVQGLSSRSLSDRACICFLGSGFHFSFFISGASHAHLLSSTGFFSLFFTSSSSSVCIFIIVSRLFLCSLAGLGTG